MPRFTDPPLSFYRISQALQWFLMAIPLLLLVGMTTTPIWAQDGMPPAVDVLDAHDNSGRGCGGCHIPHNNVSNSADGMHREAKWGRIGSPAYGSRVALSTHGKFAEMPTRDLTTQPAEVEGILLCVSCHDGNVTPQNMMAGQAYMQRVGLLPGVGWAQIPSFLGDDFDGRYAAEHPVGVAATIELGDGLTFQDGIFAVTPGSPYARFVESNGWPTLAPRSRSTPYGIDAQGRPYLVCTTCHNQHAVDVPSSNAKSAIATQGGEQSYAAFFHVNGPYGSRIMPADNRNSSSNAQFCRQCHFRFANEGNNSMTVPTAF
jgi:hypothetical protein